MPPATHYKEQPIRKSIVIVDDHPVLRRGLIALIESDNGLEVCADVGTSAEAVRAIGDKHPDLVIVDIALQGRDGLELVKEIKVRYPAVRSLVLSMHDEALYGERAIRAGAHGYVTKHQLDDKVLRAIRHVLAGGIYMSEGLKTHLASKYMGGGASPSVSLTDSLSDRELEVFRLVGDGRTTRQIAGTLKLSIKTIESHLEHIKSKLALKSAAALSHRAVQFADSELHHDHDD